MDSSIVFCPDDARKMEVQGLINQVFFQRSNFLISFSYGTLLISEIILNDLFTLFFSIYPNIYTLIDDIMVPSENTYWYPNRFIEHIRSFVKASYDFKFIKFKNSS